MEETRAFFCTGPRPQLYRAIVVAAAAGIAVHIWLKVKRRRREKKRREYPRDTVILHHLGRGYYCPSIVPFAVKLETYLRMAKIPYQCEFSREPSSKGKWPWITYNGEDMADSAFIIQFLNERYDLDLSGHLSAEQRAVAVAFQRMVEENLYWVMVATRWLHELKAGFLRQVLGFEIPFPNAFGTLIAKPHARKVLWAQGTGRHSAEEVRQIARKDFTALNNYLGGKKFLMGDEPCEEDCAIFGQLSQILWQLPDSINTMLKEDFPQLVSYCERMKDTFWPDWQQCTTQGGVCQATR